MRVCQHLHFVSQVKRVIHRRRPELIIAYDPNGMIAVGRTWWRAKRPILIWHFHELPLPNEASGGFLSRRAVMFAVKHIDKADLVIFPDQARAQHYQKAVGKSVSPIIVNNCPLRVTDAPTNMLSERLVDRGLPGSAQIVLFQGWIGPSRCIEPVIRSMRGWPKDALFVLIGPIRASYKVELDKLARSLGVAERIIFLGRVPYADLMALTAGATIGLSIVTGDADNSTNWRLTAGAINKRFEYMACGVAQVANKGPGMEALIAETDCGVLVNPNSADEIGHAIAALLRDPDRRLQMANNARSEHLTRFCYEEQFQPVLNWIDAIVRSRRAARDSGRQGGRGLRLNPRSAERRRAT